MKQIITTLLLLALIQASCNDNKANNGTAKSTTESTQTSNSAAPDDDIVGEWEQQFTCFDKNGNYKLEADEKTPSGKRLGFDWFRFNADGSCLRDKDMKFKGSYSIQEKNGNKKLMITGGDKIHYSIAELTGEELILGSDGAFIVFKRIK